ncbi:permease [Acidiphilium sp. 34-64-41]|uniref:permease n=1 Tax=Acidiphilium sp. 34-64-41 TaxID=1970297 RepID=UPI00257C2961|nr:permease [Acidiphilium sp. 34-64-41]
MVHHVAIALLHAMLFALSMGWDILWALILGFLLSGVVQAVVTKGEMGRLLPDAGPRSILIASGLGAASSSCSYAAVALARSIFRKGGNFTAAMAFQFASTNLVLELGIILAVLIGWQFTLAEFVGGPRRRAIRRSAAGRGGWRAMRRWTCRSAAKEPCCRARSRPRALPRLAISS